MINDSKIAQRFQQMLIKHEEGFVDISQEDIDTMEKFQDKIALERLNQYCDIEKIKNKFFESAFCDETWKKSPNLKFIHNNNEFLLGVRANSKNTIKLNSTPDIKKNIVEMSFIGTIGNASNAIGIDFEHAVLGYIFDDLTCYYDATRPSRMELILNSDFELTLEQKERARKLINKIISNHITKYNNQPIINPNIGKRKEKVLVIDQSYKDYSILKGCADDETFANMLESAIKENPNADIIIKTHPDAIGKFSRRPKCYYQNVVESDNIYKLTDFINPISIINYVDKVYVCSSQFGFEALMMNKEVHTFGLPFYANWGLTIDNQKCPRRNRKRTLEDVFYIAYIMFSAFYNPETQKRCEVEEILDFILKYRKMYFEKCYNGK